MRNKAEIGRREHELEEKSYGKRHGIRSWIDYLPSHIREKDVYNRDVQLEGEHYILGVDLGQVDDWTALSLTGNDGTGPVLTMRHLERMRQVLYPKIARHILKLITHPKMYNKTTVVVDATGVGPAVVDILVEAELDFVPVKITGGDKEHYEIDETLGMEVWYVPKRNIIFSLMGRFQTERLKIAEKLELRETLTEELTNFQKKQNAKTGYVTFQHREGEHDDLLLAAGLGTWAWGKFGGAVVNEALVQTAETPYRVAQDGYTAHDLLRRR